MLPMSSTNHHSHIEPSWKTYYDAKKLLRQTEQRLKDARDYYPHVHLDNNDLSTVSSTSYLLHGDTSSIHAGNRSILNDDRNINNKHQLLDSEALQTIRRKINKQKIAAERRAEQLFHSQSDAGHMFESYRPHNTYSTSASLQNLHYSPHRQQRFSPPKPQPSYSSHLSQSQSFPSELDTVLRHSTSSKLLHRENDIERQYQPITRKMAKVIPKDNYSLTNGRSTQQRSASASTGLSTKYQDLPSSHFITPSNAQRLKHVRRVESAHVSSGAGAKTSLITPDSWRTEPIVTKKSSTIAQPEKSSKQKPTVEIISKRTKTEIEEPLNHNNQRTEKIVKPKRDTSASKPSIITTEKTPLKPVPLPPAKPKSDDEKKKLQDYIQQKRQQHEEIFSNEKRLKDEQEKNRKDKLKKLNETSHQHLPSSLTKRTSAFTPITPKDLTEQTRQRLLRLLGPSTDYPSVFERSSSSSSSSSLSSSSSSASSSNNSVIEIPPTKSNDQLPIRSRSEPPIQNGSISNNIQRHENILRWAVNLTRDCDIVENRFKHLRLDSTQTFDNIPPSYQHLQHDDGNIRYQTNNSELIKSRLSNGRLHTNRLTDVNDHRDVVLDRRIYHDRAAAKIQAAYRGYSVRKSLSWLNGKQKHLNDEFNKRPIHYRDSASINIDIRLPNNVNNNFAIDSTLLRYYENPPIDDYQQQILRKTTLPLYSDDYDNVPNVPLSILSTPINHKQIPTTNVNLSLNLPSTNSSSSTTPVPSPESHVPSQIERRRSISPPLPPQMSPDNGRPLNHLTQITSQRPIAENIDLLERSKPTSRAQNPPVNTSSQQQARKSPTRQPSTSSSSSSSTTTGRKRRSPSPQPPLPQQTTTNIHSRHRTPQNSSPPTSSSESILTAREKRVRQKFNSDIELQAYEKRLKDIEKKIRQLVKRAFEIFDEKRNISNLPTVVHTTKNDLSTNIRSKLKNDSQDESSISEEISFHQKDTESIKKDNGTSSISNQQKQSDIVTSDASDLERRVHAYREQLKAKKAELEKLKQRKNKEILRRQEDELKKQIESYDQEIQTLRLQPIQQEQTVPVPLLSSSSSLTEKTKSTQPISVKFEQEDKNEEKEIESKPVETPRDERDTQHDAQSISMATDLPIESETDHDSQRESSDSEKPIMNVNINLSIPYKEKEDSISFSSSSSKSSEKSIKSPSPQVSKSPSSSSSSKSSEKPIKSPSPQVSKSPSTTSSEPIKAPSPPPPIQQHIKSPSPPPIQERIKSPSSPSPVEEHIKSPSSSPAVQQQISIPIIEQKKSQPSTIINEYDEDFSEVSHSPSNTSTTKVQIDDINIESIQEDIEGKRPIDDTNQSSTSKSSDDEQSEILVLVQKSANNTPRQENDKTLVEEVLPQSPPPPTLPTSFPPKIESTDTSHDLSENNEQGNKIDKLTETLIRTFIDEAIDQGKEIENTKTKISITKEASEWMSDDDLTDEENTKQIPITHEEDVDNAIQTLSTQPEFLEQLDTTTNGANEPEEFKLDLSRLEDKNLDEPRIESPRKLVVEEPIKPVVSHTREQVIDLCHKAITILYNQNTDFSNRSAINQIIPESYFNSDQEEVSDNPDIQRNRHAYCRMVFDLCVELLHEMYSPNVRITKYPEWQKTRLISKRFYRLNKPKTHHEAENFIQTKILEILNLIPRQITYTKWRTPINRPNDTEQFEVVLDEELRRTETQWIDYEEDCIRIKFDIAEYIFDQLVQETLTECIHVVNNRLILSSNSTRL